MVFCYCLKYSSNDYTEHCSVGPTKLIETIPSTTTARMMKISRRFLNLDF